MTPALAHALQVRCLLRAWYYLATPALPNATARRWAQDELRLQAALHSLSQNHADASFYK